MGLGSASCLHLWLNLSIYTYCIVQYKTANACGNKINDGIFRHIEVI